MTCCISYITSREPESSDTSSLKGKLPRKPVAWSVKVWMIAPDGQKTTHSFEVPACTHRDLIPAIGGQIDQLAAENGRECIQFGWQA